MTMRWLLFFLAGVTAVKIMRHARTLGQTPLVPGQVGPLSPVPTRPGDDARSDGIVDDDGEDGDDDDDDDGEGGEDGEDGGDGIVEDDGGDGGGMESDEGWRLTLAELARATQGDLGIRRRRGLRRTFFCCGSPGPWQ